MQTVKIGVLGAGRGLSMMRYCQREHNARLVAVCDYNESFLERKKLEMDDTESVTFYTDFEAFLKHDMDAVVLANFANEHAPFAIRCLQAGKHVISECLPCKTMREAVELIEAVEQSGKLYIYGENYVHMPVIREMRRLRLSGELGEFEYGEGEYVHNCEPIWPTITQGNPSHWRNTMDAAYYCTHSIAPLIHVSGLRPVKVTGFELPYNARQARMGALAGSGSIEIITLENGAIIKSLHGLGLARNSVWYSVYGTKGRLETVREDAGANDGSEYFLEKLHRCLDSYDGADDGKPAFYEPTDEHTSRAKKYGHGSGDFYCMYNAVEKILGNPEADAIDVYEAMDMFLPGLFAYRSVLAGGIPLEIPNLRDKAVRDRYRNDTMCTDKNTAGDQYIPSYSKGNPETPPEVYERIEKMWRKSLEK